MERKYKKAVYMGRFQLFHDGHMSVVHEAMAIADHLLFIIGSVNKPPSSKNPFTYYQRYNIIYRALNDAGYAGRFTIEAQKDYDYNEPKWIAEVNSHVPDASNCCIVGHSKDESSYYLKSFPRFKHVEVENYHGISATPLRESMYRGLTDWTTATPHVLRGYVDALLKTPEFKLAQEDWAADEANKLLWKDAPHPPTFITGDAIVVQSGHVLLIKRKFAPGKGLWAIPGGYINKGERINDCIIRELIEETSIHIQPQVLKGSMSIPTVYDDPSRSGRGRIVTHASIIRLDDYQPLPKVKAGDDAELAWWTPLQDLSQHNMFEDHYHIVMDLIRQ
jgi:bifunctional NMN adenylyltransferase/nudix hydrolase